MKASSSIFGSVLLAGAILVTAPGEASAKCSNYTTPGVLLVVNRDIVGDFPPTPDGNAELNEAMGAYDRADIWLVSLGCFEATDPETGLMVRRQAIYMNTTEDVADQGAAWLSEIAEVQEAYLRENGSYAETFGSLLPRLSTRLSYYIQPVSALTPTNHIQMTATEIGWSATFRVETQGIACHVMGGSVEPPLVGLVEGVPQCVVTGEPVARVAPSAPVQVRIAQ